ncbi:unnamed protein product, partial [Scytosiphon promiscuus]
MVVAAAKTLAAGVILSLATSARGFVVPAATIEISGGRPYGSGAFASSTSHTQHQRPRHQQQRSAIAPQPTSSAAFLNHVPSSRRRLAPSAAAAAAAGQGCGGSVLSTAASTTTSTMRMGLGFLAPGGGRKLAFMAMVNAAAFATVGGGVLSGGLHAVSGPDHLAALLPRIMGQKWHNSMRIGATWGLGHGFSATVIGLAAFFFKDRLGLGHNDRLVAMMGTWTEGLVGVSLIAIGLLGLKESLLDYEETPVTQSAGSAVVEGGGAGTAAGGAKAGGGGKAIFLNGVLHGFSWDGAPSLAPALALSSWGSVLWFLLAYCSGTMVS